MYGKQILTPSTIQAYAVYGNKISTKHPRIINMKEGLPDGTRLQETFPCEPTLRLFAASLSAASGLPSALSTSSPTPLRRPLLALRIHAAAACLGLWSPVAAPRLRAAANRGLAARFLRGCHPDGRFGLWRSPMALPAPALGERPLRGERPLLRLFLPPLPAATGLMRRAGDDSRAVHAVQQLR